MNSRFTTPSEPKNINLNQPPAGVSGSSVTESNGIGDSAGSGVLKKLDSASSGDEGKIRGKRCKEQVQQREIYCEG